MDRRAVTSLGVVKISRLARACGAQLGMTNDPLIQKRYVTHRLPGRPSDPKTLRHSQAARNDPLIQKRYVTHRLPGMTLWSKNVTSPTRGEKWPFRCLDVMPFTLHLVLVQYTAVASLRWFPLQSARQHIVYLFVRLFLWKIIYLQCNMLICPILYNTLCCRAPKMVSSPNCEAAGLNRRGFLCASNPRRQLQNCLCHFEGITDSLSGN